MNHKGVNRIKMMKEKIDARFSKCDRCNRLVMTIEKLRYALRTNDMTTRTERDNVLESYR